MGDEIGIKESFWRWLTNFWTIVIYLALIFDFIKNGKFDDLLGPLVSIYVPILIIYAGTKEFARWHDYHEGRHPGEVFVILWTILILGIYISSYVLNRNYHISSEVISAYITVLGVLAITKQSRSLHGARKHRH